MRALLYKEAVENGLTLDILCIMCAVSIFLCIVVIFRFGAPCNRAKQQNNQLLKCVE
jgi:hypothetical protein